MTMTRDLDYRNYVQPIGTPPPMPRALTRREHDAKIFSTVVREVAESHMMSDDEIMQRTNTRDIARARWGIMHRLRAEYRWSLPKIGKHMHKHHTTILYGLRKHAAQAA